MKILYICTHNRCRSVLSEALTNHMAAGKLQAYSAGSQPVGQVHPLTLKYLAEKGVSTQGLQSQSWDEFESIQPDIVITVCDSAANEVCPVWMGDTIKLHWGLTDPSKMEGSEAVLRSAFFDVMQTIEQRVQKLLDVDLTGLSKAKATVLLQQIIDA